MSAAKAGSSARARRRGTEGSGSRFSARVLDPVAEVPRRGYTSVMDPSFEQMTPAERVLYVQDLWDRIAAEPESVPLSEAQRVEIRLRVDEHRADPGSAVPWDQVLARARAR